jgi:hypothetical protein
MAYDDFLFCAAEQRPRGAQCLIIAVRGTGNAKQRQMAHAQPRERADPYRDLSRHKAPVTLTMPHYELRVRRQPVAGIMQQ